MAFAITLTAQSAGRPAPLAYLIGGTIVALVALSFVAFGRQVVHAGSAYAYVASVLGPRCGFVAGWALLLMYATLLAGSTALVGNFGAAALGHVGVEGPKLWLAIAMSGALIAAWLTWRNMQLAARVMLVLEATSVLAILVLAFTILTRVPLSLLPFEPGPGQGWGGIGYGIVFAVLSFAGFEAATTLGEETRHPGRSIPKAVLGTVIVASLSFVLVSYAQVVGKTSVMRVHLSTSFRRDSSQAPSRASWTSRQRPARSPAPSAPCPLRRACFTRSTEPGWRRVSPQWIRSMARRGLQSERSA